LIKFSKNGSTLEFVWLNFDLYLSNIEKSVGKRPLRRPRHRWEDNIKMDSPEVELEGVDWIHQVQDRDHGGIL
jgi:hypothetical protein